MLMSESNPEYKNLYFCQVEVIPVTQSYQK